MPPANRFTRLLTWRYPFAVVDNQFVHRSDVLYVIDPFDFQVALDTQKAQLQQMAADLQVKRQEAERRDACCMHVALSWHRRRHRHQQIGGNDWFYSKAWGYG